MRGLGANPHEIFFCHALYFGSERIFTFDDFATVVL